MADAVSFRQASATALPFADAGFDGAYMLHVGMNIADKKAVFAEVRRVLKPGGIFGIYDAMRESDGPFAYPVPWSSEAATNHIDTPDTYKAALTAAGFTVIKERNRRDFALQSMQQRVAQAGQPIGLPVVMGATAAQKLANMRAMIEGGVFAPYEIIARAARP
jgi:ubiquinone/menaquinone biosynthesis C-methylase UbiE